eukprot:Rmarinus@m.23591
MVTGDVNGGFPKAEPVGGEFEMASFLNGNDFEIDGIGPEPKDADKAGLRSTTSILAAHKAEQLRHWLSTSALLNAIEELKRVLVLQDMTPFLLFVNIFVIIVGVIAIALVDRYFNDLAVANSTSDLLRNACERLITEVDQFYMLPILINQMNVKAFERGDIVLGPLDGSDGLSGRPYPNDNGNVTNMNDFHFVSQLEVYPNSVNYIYVATERGYYFGAARRNNNEDIMVITREADQCRRKEYPRTADGYRIYDDIPLHRTIDEDQVTCGNTDCTDESSGYAWEYDPYDDQYYCRKFEIYDHRLKGWFQEAVARGPNQILWSSAYADVASGSITITAMQTVEYLRADGKIELAVFAVDVAVDEMSVLLKSSDILDELGAGGQNFLMEYQPGNPERQGMLWGTSDPDLHQKLRDGYLMNVIAERELYPDEVTTGVFVPPEYVQKAVDHLSEQWLSLDVIDYPTVDGLTYNSYGAIRYVLPEEDIPGASVCVCAANMDTRTYAEGVVVISIPRSVVYDYYDICILVTIVMSVLSVAIPLMRLWMLTLVHRRMDAKKEVALLRDMEDKGLLDSTNVVTKAVDGSLIFSITSGENKGARYKIVNGELIGVNPMGQAEAPLPLSELHHSPSAYVGPEEQKPTKPANSNVGVNAATFLTIVTVVLIFITHAAWSSQGMAKVQSITQDMTDEVNRKARASVAELLDKPPQINHLIGDGLRQLSSDNDGPTREAPLFIATYQYFSDQIDVYATSRTPMTFLYLGANTGELIGVGLENNTKTYYVTEPHVNGSTVCLFGYDVDENNEPDRSAISFQKCPYDARDQGWFQNTDSSGELRWTDIYKFFSDEFGMTSTVRFYAADVTGTPNTTADLAITTAVDVTLNQVSEYLYTDDPFSIFLMEPYSYSLSSGALVAATDGVVTQDVMGSSTRIYTNMSDDDTTVMVSEYMQDSFYEDSEHLFGDMEMGYGQLRSQVTIDVFPGLDWDSVVAIPRSVFMEDFDDYSAISLMICFFILMLATFTGFGATIYLTAAKQLKREAQNRKRLAHPVDEDGFLRPEFYPQYAGAHNDAEKGAGPGGNESADGDGDGDGERGSVKGRHEKLEDTQGITELRALKKVIGGLMGKFPETVGVIHGKSYVTTPCDYRPLVGRGESVRIGGVNFTIDPEAPFTPERMPLDSPWEGETCEEVGVFKCAMELNESEQETAKRYILDAGAGRSVLDIIQMERAGASFRRSAYYLVSSRWYNWLVLSVMTAHHFLAFFEAPGLNYSITDTRRRNLLVAECLILFFQIFDVCAALYINGIFMRDRTTNERVFRKRNIIRALMTVLIFFDWLIRVCGVEYTTGGTEGTLLPYSSIVRPILVVAQNDNLASTFINFFKTIVEAKDVFVVLLCFLAVSASMGITLLQGVYEDAVKLGRGYDDFRSAFITSFIFIATGENYPEVVYPAAEENSAFKLYYMVFFFIGMFLLVSLIIGLFQEKYTKNYERVEHEKRLMAREGLIAAFILLDLDDSEILDPGEYQDFFLNVCCTGTDFSLLRGVSFNLKDWVEVCEDLVQLFDSAPTLMQREWAASIIQRYYRGYQQRKTMWDNPIVKKLLMSMRMRVVLEERERRKASGQKGDVPLSVIIRRLFRRGFMRGVVETAKLLGSEMRYHKMRVVHKMNKHQWFRRVRFALVTGLPLMSDWKAICKSMVWGTVVQLVVIANMWTVCLLSTRAITAVGPLFLCFLVFYVFETIFKILAYGTKGYFKHHDPVDRYDRPARRWDFCIILIATVTYIVNRAIVGSIFIDEDDSMKVMVAIPTLRVFAVVPGARQLIFGIFSVLPGMAVLFMLFFVVVYMFAAVGCIMYAGSFAGIPIEEYHIPDANFNSFIDSLTTLFHMMAAESWSSIMYAAIDATSSYDAGIYFIFYMLVISLLFTNLFIGVVCDAFHTLQETKGQVVSKKEDAMLNVAKKAQNLRATEAVDALPKVDVQLPESELTAMEKGFSSAQARKGLIMRVESLRETFFFAVALSVKLEILSTHKNVQFDTQAAFHQACVEEVDPYEYRTWLPIYIARLERKQKLQAIMEERRRRKEEGNVDGEGVAKSSRHDGSSHGSEYLD